MEVLTSTVSEAKKRVIDNEAALEVCESQIKREEENQRIAGEDRDTAQADLDAETERWETAVASYEDLMEQLQLELDAIDKCLELFSQADISQTMLDRLDVM